MTLAFAQSLAVTFVGIGLWGAHMALTQWLLAKLVADPRPRGAALHSSAFGVFNLATGLTLLAASIIAGLLWDQRISLGRRSNFSPAPSSHWPPV